ncbi:TetR/AcrR family transcriptional regulator [Bacillus coahuilensis]|uniref:TetR/AcrR family transcriptional regulator n=1 Tax=Bacillus coahuilensis TaxID=408580 RepID=UPI00018506A3|nr:TetR/AcrR family transcriptional regulator [Bacillus coahuilensis]
MDEFSTILDTLIDEQESLTQKQRNILEAAVEIFSEKGFAATSTSEIAKKAGVAEGTIFRHYRTKQDLLLAIVAPTMAKLIGPFVLKDVFNIMDNPNHSYESLVRAILVNRLEFLRKNRILAKILILEMPYQEELKRQFMEHIIEKARVRLEKAIGHYKQEGEIVEMPSQSLMRFTLSTVIGHVVFHEFLFRDPSLNEEEEVDRTMSLLMYGVKGKRE